MAFQKKIVRNTVFSQALTAFKKGVHAEVQVVVEAARPSTLEDALSIAVSSNLATNLPQMNVGYYRSNSNNYRGPRGGFRARNNHNGNFSKFYRGNNRGTNFGGNRNGGNFSRGNFGAGSNSNPPHNRGGNSQNFSPRGNFSRGSFNQGVARSFHMTPLPTEQYEPEPHHDNFPEN